MTKELEKIITSINYFCPSRYVSGRIVEYDIKSANINILKKANLISDDDYFYLSSIPKIDREIYIGLLEQKDKKYSDAIKNGIKDSKLLLAINNDLQSKEIVRIANDAVYVNRPVDLQFTIFDNIVFKHNNIYSSVIKLGFVIIFIWYDNNGNMNMDVKGLGDNDYLHQNYMLSIIGSIINLAERSSVADALQLFSSIYQDYVNLRLDKECYREFNSASKYRYKNSKFLLLDIDNINDIDINYNLSILRELFSILIENYKK